MDTESLKFARFDHPKHGVFETIEAVSGDERLGGDEKREILAEWKRRVAADSTGDPEAARLGESLDAEIARLARMGT